MCGKAFSDPTVSLSSPSINSSKRAGGKISRFMAQSTASGSIECGKFASTFRDYRFLALFFLTNRILARSIELFSVCDSHPWHDCGEKKSFQIKDIDFGADIAARSRES
jgi:hypothetical protein